MALTVVSWTMPARQQDERGRWIDRGRSRPTRKHVSTGSGKSACGAWIPPSATVAAVTADWHHLATCYNCVHRLWRDHKPEGFIRPSSGKDFPLRRECPHSPGRELDPRYCRLCTPAEERGAHDPNWPCPNGCGEPHNLVSTYPQCAIHPPRHDVPDGAHCPPGQCESAGQAIHAANPRLFLDLPDSTLMTCYHCRGTLCGDCRRTSADDFGTCEECAAADPPSWDQEE
jgi:hypothetical protein